METSATIHELVHTELQANADAKNAAFVAKIIPDLSPAIILGVKTPALRALAKTLSKRDDLDQYLTALPHDLFEENQVHGFIVSGLKDYDRALDELERFLPYIDNWATCDQTNPKVLTKDPVQTLAKIALWLRSDEPYVTRFGIHMLRTHFLGDLFEPAQMESVASVSRENYYVNMMRAWYFAEAVVKQPKDALANLENRRLDPWTHNKAIQKARESRRVSPDLKNYLVTLKY